MNTELSRMGALFSNLGIRHWTIWKNDQILLYTPFTTFVFDLEDETFIEQRSYKIGTSLRNGELI